MEPVVKHGFAFNTASSGCLLLYCRQMLYSAALSNSAQAASLILPTLIQSARCCTPQPIKIQTAAGSVETAVLHLFDMQPLVPAQTPAPVPSTVASPSSTSAADMRVCALHQRSPIHMYIFDSKGALLIANKAASEGLQSGEHCRPALGTHQGWPAHILAGFAHSTGQPSITCQHLSRTIRRKSYNLLLS